MIQGTRPNKSKQSATKPAPVEAQLPCGDEPADFSELADAIRTASEENALLRDAELGRIPAADALAEFLARPQSYLDSDNDRIYIGAAVLALRRNHSECTPVEHLLRDLLSLYAKKGNAAFAPVSLQSRFTQFRQEWHAAIAAAKLYSM